MGINYNNAVYLFQKNVLGDVTHIYDTEGNLKARYIYDAWGNHKIVDMDEADPIGEINPIRYRSYYYDVETGLYYLRARYYDPETGRFISQDDTQFIDSQHLMGLHLYAYCGNNSIMREDSEGELWNILIGAGVGVVVGAVVSAATQLMENPDLSLMKTGEFWGHVGVAAGVGAISGGLAASGVGLAGQVLVNAGLGAVSGIADTMIDDDGNTTTQTYALKAVEGATIGAIAGLIGGKGSASKHVTNSFKRVLRTGNWSYYFSQVNRQAIREGKQAISGIFKATLPTIFKSCIRASN